MKAFDITDPTNKAAIDATADNPALDLPAKWRQAVRDLLDYWVSKGRCFSSGEIAATLRTHRPDAMIFSVPSLGEYIRDLFYNGMLPSYTVDDGNGGTMQMPPMQVPRYTEGLYPDRTPAGVEVFVYGPDHQSCLDHEFEVFIPNPARGETVADAPAQAMAQTALAAADKTGKTKTAVEIMGARIAAQDIRAKVWPDGRLCIPRNAFEAAVHLGGTPMRGGDPVFVKVDSDRVVVTLAATGDPAEKSYDLTRSHGRIAITHPTTPFPVGATFKCSVAAGIVIVDLKTPS